MLHYSCTLLVLVAFKDRHIGLRKVKFTPLTISRSDNQYCN